MTDHISHDGQQDVAVLRDEIRQTRADLGETVQALAAKADLKARAKESAGRTAAQLRQSAQQSAAQLRQSAEQMPAKLRQSAGQTAERAKLAARDAGESARQHPDRWLGVGAGVLAAAVLVGVTVLVSRRVTVVVKRRRRWS